MTWLIKHLPQVLFLAGSTLFMIGTVISMVRD